MDTISRENNSYLPVAALIVGVLALVLSGVALAKISSAKQDISAQVEPLTLKIDELDGMARNAASTATSAADRANNASSGISSLQRSTQDAFTQVAQELGNIRGEITKVQEARPAAAAPRTATASGPAAAGPDEYVVKSGDTGFRIAQANGVTVADLQAVNPGVNWNGLKVGQKIKLPAKR